MAGQGRGSIGRLGTLCLLLFGGRRCGCTDGSGAVVVWCRRGSEQLEGDPFSEVPKGEPPEGALRAGDGASKGYKLEFRSVVGFAATWRQRVRLRVNVRRPLAWAVVPRLRLGSARA